MVDTSPILHPSLKQALRHLTPQGRRVDCLWAVGTDPQAVEAQALTCLIRHEVEYVLLAK
jgi:hypothetical protein